MDPLEHEEEDTDFTWDIGPVVISVVSVIFNLLILLTFGFQRWKMKRPHERVALQLMALAVTDVLDSAAILIHFSVRIHLQRRGELKETLRQTIRDGTNGLHVTGEKYVAYVGCGFFLIKRITKHHFFNRFFTVRFFLVGWNRLLLIYINIAKVVDLYSNTLNITYRHDVRNEIGTFLKIFLAPFFLSALIMVIWVATLYAAVDEALYIMATVYIVYYLIPFVVLLFATVLLLKKLTSFRRRLRRLWRRSDEKPAEWDEMTEQLKIMIIVVTLAYLITHLPGVIHAVAKVVGASRDFGRVAARVAAAGFALNSLVNFPLFLKFSTVFRRSFLGMLRCRRSPDETPPTEIM